jgi:hypothetical protein
MTAEGEIFKALDKAYWTALLLSGSTEVAETAVLNGIAAIEFDYFSGDGLVLETAKSAIRRRSYFKDQLDPAFSLLPIELRRVLLLAPSRRYCFVLRALLRVPPEVCSRILDLSVQQVDDALRRGMQELPLVGGCGSNSV